MKKTLLCAIALAGFLDADASYLFHPYRAPILGETDFILPEGVMNDQKGAEVEVEPFTLNYGVSNNGTRYVGPWAAIIELKGENAFGAGESFSVGTAQAPRETMLQQYYFTYKHSLFESDLSGYIKGETTQIRVGGPSKALKSRSYPESLLFGVEYSLVSKKTDKLKVGLEFDMKNSRGEVRSIGLVAKDRLRILRGVLRYDFSDIFLGQNILNIQISKGIPSLGATKDDASMKRRGGSRSHTDYWKGTFNFLRNQLLPHNFNMQFAFDLQLTSKRVVFSEADQLHISPYKRYSPELEFFGDSSVQYRGKLGYTIDKEMVNHGLDRLELYTAFAQGHLWRRNPMPGIGQCLRAGAVSIGVMGLLPNKINFFVEQTFPFTKKVGTKKVNQITYVGINHQIKF